MIECKNLVFGYSKNLLFNNLFADFEQGHIYGLLGKNGAGKTTLLKCITGLLHPNNGEINVMGKNSIKRLPEILKDTFFFPENFYLPSFTGEKYYQLYSEFYPSFDKDYFIKTCKEFEIPLNKSLTTLSFGQKKKFFLAFGLSTFAKVMLLDEPTNGLDIPSKTSVRKKIAESLTENQIFIISTHQVRDLSQLFDRIIILHDGKIIFNNSLDYISQNYSITTESNFQDNQEKAIYFEESATGKIYLIDDKNINSSVDLEFFFNAVISNPEAFSLSK
ncbi:MAG: ABC transporter ATP-binding protein [Exilispira sp.]|jgi:ABC-2 type transport system ATP-binding protein|nr:ABC transporter ATP-binding protein [Exilispira sp.]